MLSKIQSKQTIGGDDREYFITTKKRIINHNDKHEIKISNRGQSSQFVKRADAITVKTTKDDIRAFANVLKSMKRVRRISIRCEGSELDNEDLKALVKSLERLSSLQSINLNLAYCRRITDQGLENLGESLKRLSSLQSINLNFDRCQEITDQGLENLAESLKRLSSLQFINLNFEWCRTITDQGLKSLAESLSPLISLQSINLKFGRCERITDQGLKNLDEGLKTLSFLRFITLNFERCQEITNQALKDLAEELKNSNSYKTSRSFLDTHKLMKILFY